MAKRGRPRKLADAELFAERAEAYFDECKTNGELPTIPGLTLAVGLSDVKRLWEYQQRPDFSESVKRAKLRIEVAWVQRLAHPAATGAIFQLKHAFHYRDTWPEDVGGAGKLIIEDRTGDAEIVAGPAACGPKAGVADDPDAPKDRDPGRPQVGKDDPPGT